MDIKINISSLGGEKKLISTPLSDIYKPASLNSPKIEEKKAIKPISPLINDFSYLKNNKNNDLSSKAGLNSALEEVESLIGLKDIKNLIYEVRAFAEIQKLREKEQLLSQPTVLHAVFKGNPGSGKTTVARLLAEIYKEMGVLSKGQLIEVERADLVGEFIGHTAQKTKDNVKKALGGVLFIDEAYSLCRGGDKDFGREAIDALVKAMEDHKEDFVLILAGYNQEMDEFIHANPGLQSRLPLQIDFPDYNLEELLAISKLMYQKREYLLSEGSKIELERALRRVLLQDPRYNGNARTVRNLVEASLRCQAVRLINNKKQDQENLDKEGLSLINEADIRLAAHKVFANKKRKENQANRNNDIPEAQAY